jgi:[ribosomal protein S18]-alanine N-acetyltransferase
MMAESQPSGIDHFPVASRGLPEVVVLTTEDVQELAQLEGMCFAQPWSLAQLRKALASDAYLALGLRVNGVLTAYASLTVLPPEMEILNLAVEPSCRGQGLGKQLAREALRHAWSRGVQTCFLEVDAGNEPALRLYTALGFARTGIRPGYYPSPTGRRDAVIMQYRMRNFQFKSFDGGKS